MELSENQRERYARHLVLEGFGEVGQKRLLEAKVLVIGTGGLGSPVTLYLAASGVGTIGLVDSDVVDLSNLQRQIIHTTKDLNRLKVESAKDKASAINPEIKINTYHMFVDANNIRSLIREYDFIVDCTDNFGCKFLINDACVLEQKPFCHGAILRFGGQLMTYVPKKGPCYRCVFEDLPPKDSVPTSKEVGIVGVVPGVIGTLQATEVIKYFIGSGDLLVGYLLTYDALTMTFRKVKISNNDECLVCGKNPCIKELDTQYYE